MNEPEPLSDLASALLAEEQNVAVDRSALRARVGSRLAAALPGLIDVAPPLDAPPAPTPPGGALPALAKPVTIAAGKLAAILAATFAVGAAAGVVIDRRLPSAAAPAPLAVSAPPVPVMTDPSPPASAPPPPPSSEAPAPAASIASTATALPAPSADRRSDLARERALIDAARSGVAHGNAPAALDAVRRHAETFPQGQLSEERDALRILALVSLGRREEATRYDRAFRARYPQSLLRSQIDDALSGAPR